MEVSSDTTVHIDFEIDRRDLFRISLIQAKWRLVAGFLIFLIFAAKRGH